MVNSMKTLCKYEMLRMLYHKKIILLVIMFLMVLFGTVFYNDYKNSNYVNNRIQELEESYTYAGSMRENAVKNKNREENKFWKVEEYTLSMILTHYRNDDVVSENEMMQYQIKRNQNILDNFDKGYFIKIKGNRDEYKQQLKNEVEIYDYMLKHKIKPYSSPYEMNGLNFLSVVMHPIVVVVGVFLLIVLITHLYCEDFEGGTYKILYSCAYQRKTWFHTKHLVSVLMLGMGIILSILCVFLYCCIVNGIGSFDYPYWLGNQRVVDCLAYLSRYYLLLTMYFLFMIEFTLLISVLVSSASVVYAITGGIMFMTYEMHELMFSNLHMISWCPFMNLFSADVLQTNHLYALNILICIIGGIFFYKIAENIFCQRDFHDVY